MVKLLFRLILLQKYFGTEALPCHLNSQNSLSSEENSITDKQQQLLQIYLNEYDKLKSEQARRIGFRDSMIYVTLGVFGGIFSFALADKVNYYALLVIPWVCLILGWTYLVNDEKISAIGKYIRLTLTDKIKKSITNLEQKPTNAEQNQTKTGNYPSIFGWEISHRSDDQRKRRKIEQLIIDEITFVCPGIVALFAFWFSASKIPLVIHLLCSTELFLLLILCMEIIIYADLKTGQ